MLKPAAPGNDPACRLCPVFTFRSSSILLRPIELRTAETFPEASLQVLDASALNPTGNPPTTIAFRCDGALVMAPVNLASPATLAPEQRLLVPIRGRLEPFCRLHVRRASR